jgi:hypothetical protein
MRQGKYEGKHVHFNLAIACNDQKQDAFHAYNIWLGKHLYIKDRFSHITSDITVSDRGPHYNGSESVLRRRQLGSETGIAVGFSCLGVAGEEKGTCDMTGAHGGSHIKKVVKSGRAAAVQCADTLVAALNTDGGVKGLEGIVMDDTSLNRGKKANYQTLPGISKFSVFEYTSQGVRAWQEFDIGKGKLIKSSVLDQTVRGEPVGAAYW